MNILITGGAGFLGQRLAAALLARAALHGPDGRDQAIDHIVLVDLASAPDLTDDRVIQVTGDIADADLLAGLIDTDTTAIFHLAAVVSGMAEADFDLGMRINVDVSRALIEVCRARGHRPRVVFASSVAVYGASDGATVSDTSAVAPLSSYGTQKAVVELLVNDYSRRGFIDGRVVRLPTVSVRPGRPNAAASSFASGIIREPLNGEAAVCPVPAGTRLWLMSPSTAIAGLIRSHELSAEAFGSTRIVNLPGISVTVAEMVAALERVAGPDVAARIRWEPDPAIERIVGTWPGEVDAARARALGFPSDRNFDDIVRQYVNEQT